MRTDSLFTATITKLSHEGRGIARLDGKTQFIDNALPEEIVKAKCLKTHSKYDEAIAKEIIIASPNRVTPVCNYYLTCGGCRLQHLADSAQILFKQNLLAEQLAHVGKCQAKEWLTPLQAKSYAYRRKARFAVHYAMKEKKLQLGFKQMDGQHVVDLTHCPVVHEKISNLLAHLSHLLGQLSNAQKITEIICSMGDDDLAIILQHHTSFKQNDLPLLISFAKQHNIALYHRAEHSETIAKLWPENNQHLLYYTLPAYQLTLAFHPQDFTQINSEINRLMIDQMLDLLELQANDRVLDLFCGMGNLSLPIARFAQQVWGIEGNAKMVQQAMDNAQINGLTNASFVTENLKQPRNLLQRFPANKVVIDPPRNGAIDVLPHVIALKAERIVYISCNPATLARDSAYLTNHGYVLSKAGVMDMFPQTQHVESITLFHRT